MNGSSKYGKPTTYDILLIKIENNKNIIQLDNASD